VLETPRQARTATFAAGERRAGARGDLRAEGLHLRETNPKPCVLGSVGAILRPCVLPASAAVAYANGARGDRADKEVSSYCINFRSYKKNASTN
jgi:hypothetical protein